MFIFHFDLNWVSGYKT